MSQAINFEVNELGSGRWTRNASGPAHALPSASPPYFHPLAATAAPPRPPALKWLAVTLLGLGLVGALLVLSSRGVAGGYVSYAGAMRDLGSSFAPVAAPLPAPATPPSPLPAAPAAVPQEGGLALRQTRDYDVRGLPSISVAMIERVLAAYHSPALGTGQGFYDLGLQYGIDPAFLLAFFVHESSAGTQGAAVANLSVGNIRCVADYRCGGGYAAYDSWRQGAEHWYKLITQSGLYCGAGSDRCTPETIIPRYAPSADDNDEAAYITAVESLVSQWRSPVR